MPLHVSHRNLIAGEDQKNIQNDDYHGGELTYPTHDRAENGNSALVALDSGLNDAGDAHASPTQPSLPPPTSHDWNAVEEHEERLMDSFVRQISTIMSIQCCASLILSKLLRHARHGGSGHTQPTTVYVVAGALAVGAGVAILGKADCRIQGWFTEHIDDCESENHGSENMHDLPLNQSTVESMGMMPGQRPRTLTLACHRTTWRRFGHALMSAGFAISMAPLLLGSRVEDKTRLITLCGFLGSSCSAATVCLIQRIAKAMHPGSLPIFQGKEERDACKDICHGEEEGADACMQDTSKSPHVLAAAARWQEAFSKAATHARSAAVASLLMKVSFTATVFSGGYVMSRWAEHASGVNLPWTNSVAAAGRPIFLVLLGAGDLRNKYRTCYLRVFCPPRTRPGEEGASKSLQMWHSAHELLHHSALERQLVSLQVSTNMHTIIQASNLACHAWGAPTCIFWLQANSQQHVVIRHPPPKNKCLFCHVFFCISSHALRMHEETAG
jgi:hypothetical protein